MINGSGTIRRRTDEEWLGIINECRQSGLSDHEWCEIHHISQSSFYTAIRRLRSSQKLINPPVDTITATPYVQDIVQIEVEAPAPVIPVTQTPTAPERDSSLDKPIELCINGVRVGIDNNADPHLISEIIRMIGGSYAG